jgi:hypothetical protein
LNRRINSRFIVVHDVAGVGNSLVVWNHK